MPIVSVDVRFRGKADIGSLMWYPRGFLHEAPLYEFLLLPGMGAARRRLRLQCASERVLQRRATRIFLTPAFHRPRALVKARGPQSAEPSTLQLCQRPL